MQNGQDEHRKQVEQSLRLVKLFMSLEKPVERDELLLMVETYVARKQTRQA